MTRYRPLTNNVTYRVSPTLTYTIKAPKRPVRRVWKATASA